MQQVKENKVTGLHGVTLAIQCHKLAYSDRNIFEALILVTKSGRTKLQDKGGVQKQKQANFRRTTTFTD